MLITNKLSSTWASKPDPKQALEIALKEFQDQLTPEQKVRLNKYKTVIDVDAVQRFTIDLDEERARHKRRGVAVRIYGFLECVQRFSSIVDTFAGSSVIGSTIWGCVKVTFFVVANISGYFEKLTEFILNLRSDLPRFELYRDLFPSSTRLKASLFTYFALLVKLCAKVVEVSQRSAMKQISLASWRPFEAEFGPIKSGLEGQCRQVEAEIQLAAEQASVRARQLGDDERNAMSKFRDIMNSRSEEDYKLKLQIVERDARNRKEDLLKNLADHPYEGSWSRARKQRWGQTGTWFIDSAEFKRWQTDDELPVLWCSGDLGCGKTVLSAHVITTVMTNANMPNRKVLYFFCDFNYPVSFTARLILSCLMKQVLSVESVSPHVESGLKDLFRLEGDDAAEQIGFMLKRVMEKQPCCIILDGVDECSRVERKALFRVLRDIVSTRSCTLFLSSRPDLKEEVATYFQKHIAKYIKRQNTGEDIEEFVDGALQERLDDGKLKVQDIKIISEIKTALIQGANGMFLWARLQLEEICSQLSDYDIRKTLMTLPKDLVETYTRALTKIQQSSNSQIAEKEVQWIAGARRPLTIQELREAIAIDPLQTSRQTDRYVNDSTRLISGCAGLVTLDEEDNTVRFVHHSVQMFLTDLKPGGILQNFLFKPQRTDMMITEACVTYLWFSDFQTQLVKSSQGKKPPGFDTTAMLATTLSATLNENISGPLIKIAQMYMPRSKSSKNENIVRLLRGQTDSAGAHSSPEPQDGYFFLIYANKHWLQHSAHLSEKISSTLWRRWKSLLLDESSIAPLPWERDEFDIDNDSIRNWIIENKHFAVAQVLLAKGGKPRSYTFIAENRMMLIRQNGLAFDLLVKLSKAKSLEGGMLKIVLFHEAFSGYNEMIESFSIERGDNGQARIDEMKFLTPLQLAAKHGHAEVVYALIAAGADVNATSGEKEQITALNKAADGDNLDASDEPVDAGDDVNAAPLSEFGIVGITGLQIAAFRGHRVAVRRLISYGANVNLARLNMGSTSLETPLQLALKAGHEDIANILRKAGAV